MSCLEIKNEDMREIIVTMLTGDFHKMESLILSNGNTPFQIADWSGERRGISDTGILDSFQFSYALYDALKNNEYGKKLNVVEMWRLHQKMMPQLKRTPYDQFRFVIWNWWEEPGDNPYIDDEDEQFLLNTGVPQINIDLTNYGIQHMEEEVIKLLKKGASPYFLVTLPYMTNIYKDEEGNVHYTYFNVAPMLEVTKVHSDDYWFTFIHDYLDKDVRSLETSVLEEMVEGFFNVGACERILHLTDEYLCKKSREEGDLLMLKYLGKIHSIVE